MQLQDISLDSLKDKLDPRLLTTLEDIATNVHIQDGFCICHPNYKPLELPSEAVERLNEMPSALQQKYLSSQLRSFLYGIYYNGSLKATLAPESEQAFDPQGLENNTFLGVDLEFYEQIHAANSGSGYFDDGWVVLREEVDGAIAVTKNGLTVHIERDRHLKSADEEIVVGGSLAIRLPKNLMQNGFYVAVSDAGTHSHQILGTQLIRIYWNLNPEGALAVMGCLTQKLNDLNVPFAFKVLYNPSDYNRHDAGVLYFDDCHYDSVHSVLRSIHSEHQSHFRPETPLFTKHLAPDWALLKNPLKNLQHQKVLG
jgi:hypothetical protein